MTRTTLLALCLIPLGNLTSSWSSSAHAEQTESLSADTWYKVGMGYLKDEKFLSAGDAFFQAYQLAGEPALLYNAARSYEKGGQLERAKKLYLKFTIQDGVEKKRKEKAIAHIEDIDSKLATRQLLPTQNVQKAPPKDEPATYWKWLAIGSGLALTVGAGVMVEIAAGNREELTAKLQEDSSGQTSGVSQFDAFTIRDEANSLETAALVCGIAGTSLIVTGIALWIFGEETPPVALGPLDGGLLLSAGGAF